MPGSPRSVFSNLKSRTEELKEKAEMFYLDQSMQKVPRRPRKGKQYELMMDIYEIFITASDNFAGKHVRLPATEFDKFEQSHSPMSLNRVKKILGIKSIRKGGKWWWTFPLRSPSEAMDKIHERRVKDYNPYREELKQLDRPRAKELHEIMKEHHNEILNTEALHLMERAGYVRHTILSTKSMLGIISKKTRGAWMWYYVDQELIDWLEAKLSTGPVPMTQIFIEAEDEKNWSEDLMRIAQKAMTHIKMKYNHSSKTWSWMDINAATSDPAANKPDITESRIVELEEAITDDEDRVLTVDFSDLEPDNPVETDTPVTEQAEITINGVKIGTFR